MSINPVPAIGPVSDGQSADARSDPRQQPASAASGTEIAQPDPGTQPNQETRIPQNVSESNDLPQDEVQVQRDTETTEIVIKYLDRSGSVILQVPSSQVLALAHAIAQDFHQAATEQQAAQGERATEADGEGGKVHGH